jgi:3-oxoacyl-ACP reductase-like protein
MKLRYEMVPTKNETFHNRVWHYTQSSAGTCLFIIIKMVTTSPAAPVAVAAPTGPVASIEDVPVKAIDILLVVVAQKLKKRIDKIQVLSKTIEDLVGGKSTVQNEILGDLQQELASAPEKGQELPLEELGSALTEAWASTAQASSRALESVARCQMVSMLPPPLRWCTSRHHSRTPQAPCI